MAKKFSGFGKSKEKLTPFSSLGTKSKKDKPNSRKPMLDMLGKSKSCK